MTYDGAVAGSVSVTELGSRAGAVLRVVRSGQPVPVTRHGSVVGVFQPTNAAAALRLGIDLDDRSRSVSARELERGNPSAVIDRVADGETVLVTVRNVPAAVLTPATEWDAGLEQPTDLGSPVPLDSQTGADASLVARTITAQLSESDMRGGIVLRPIDEESGGVVMSDAGRKQFSHGEVIAVGVGEAFEDWSIHEVVEIGDTVLFPRHGGFDLTVEGDDFVVIDGHDVLATVKVNPARTRGRADAPGEVSVATSERRRE